MWHNFWLAKPYGHIQKLVRLGSTKKRMLLTEAIGIESQSNKFPKLEPFKMAGEELLSIYCIFTIPKWILRMSNLITK